MNCRLFVQHVSSFFMLYWVLTELWILEKFWNLPGNFSDVKKYRNYRWSLENGKKSWGFFFSKLWQVLYKWNFLFNLVNSNSISTVRLQCIVKKGLFLQFLRSLLITYLMTSSVENKLIVLEKVWKSLEFWIQKSVRILSIAPPFNIPVMRYQSCCLSCEMSFVPKNVWRSNFKTIVHLCSRVSLFKKFTVNRHVPKIRYLFFLLSFRWKKPSMPWETQNLGCIEWLLVITLVSSLINWRF